MIEIHISRIHIHNSNEIMSKIIIFSETIIYLIK